MGGGTVIKRVWTSRGPTGHRVKKVAYGYTVVVNGRRERVYNGAWTKDDARDALAARVLERDAPAASRVPKLFAQVVVEYLDFKRAKGKRSVDGDAITLKRFLSYFGETTPVVEITAQRIAQYDRDRVTHMSRLGRAISPASVNRELACLRHLLRLAEEWGHIPKAPRVRMAREPEGRLRFLDEGEAVRLLDACRVSKNPWLFAIVTIALNTGMRRGEILGLSWERVDFGRGVLQLEVTKNGRRREIPMNRAVDAALSGLPGPKVEGLVFRRADGSAWGAVRTAFERACRAAKIEDFRFHDLRHTAASWLIMRGRHLKEVQELLGHRTFTMTLRYAHLSPDRLREAVASLDDVALPVASGTKRAQSATIGVERRVSP
jgi:integrase